jgi:hypothetical protein
VVIEETEKSETKQEEESTNEVKKLPELALEQEEKKLDGAPEGDLYVVTVLSREEFQPSEDLEQEIVTLKEVVALKTSSTSSENTTEEELSWAKEYAALDSVRRLAIHHVDELKTELYVI